MKYIILLALLITSCRTGRHFEHSGTNTRSETQHQSSTYTWRQLDSNNRYWLYWGDSCFYYHPDKGLYALQGTLWVEESQINSSTVQASDSSSIDNRQFKYSTATWSTRYRSYRIWLLGGISIVLLFYLWYRRGRR